MDDSLVEMIKVDRRLLLTLSDLQGSGELTVEVPFCLHRPDGTAMLDPARTSSLAPVLDLFGVGVRRVEIGETGRLLVEFKNNNAIEVHGHDDYEAWQIALHCYMVARWLFVCNVGGEVAVFEN